MQWKKSDGESREDHSRIFYERRHVDQMEDERAKHQQKSGDGETEHITGWDERHRKGLSRNGMFNTYEMRDIGRGLVGMVCSTHTTGWDERGKGLVGTSSTLTVSGTWRRSTWLWLSWGYSVFRDRALSSPSSLTVFDGTLCMIRDMCRCRWRTSPSATLLCICRCRN